MDGKLKAYFPIADMLVATFGANCEVAIHDLSQPESSVIYVAGSVTGRMVGQSFDHLVRDVLLSSSFDGDHVSNYIFSTPDGKVIKSSTVFLRDGEEAIGALCLNYDITVGQQFLREMGDFCSAAEQEAPEKEVELRDDVVSMIDGLIANIIDQADMENMTRKKAVELVRFMDEKGIFLVKGAIDKVAARLGVSKVTIYSYLDEAKGKKHVAS